MPPELSKFLKLIKNKLYYSDHDIVVISYSELEEAGLSVSDLKQITTFLKEKGIIVEESRYNAYPWSTIPTEYEEKKRVLKESGHEGGVKQTKTKAWEVIKISSKKKFNDFYNGIEEDASSPSKVDYDSMNSVIKFGNKKYSIKNEKRQNLVRALFDHKNERMQKPSIIRQTGLIDSAREFSDKHKDWLDKERSYLNKIFKDKGFPLHISTKGGVELTEKEE